jgi:hypothetical protein
MGALTWKCRCGALRAELQPGDGTHLICYCKDCQAYARHLGAAELLDAGGGTAVYATLPHRLKITRGAEHLALLRLGPKGPFRWYAACCATPFANTAATAKLPFASLLVHGLEEPAALGPVRACLRCEEASGPVAGRARSPAALAWPAMARALKARVSGRHRDTPFFDAGGAPVAAPRVLSRAERAAATP